MKIAIYSRVLNKSLSPFVKTIFQNLMDRGAHLLVHETLMKCVFAKSNPDARIQGFSSHTDIRDKVDFLISIGGDGTLLDTIALIRDSGIPVIGINTGRLGFLANIAKEETKSAIDNLFRKNYSLDKRSLISIEASEALFGEVNYGLNEFTIHKKDSSSMVTVHAYLNGDYLNSYWADGLIIATPTGSTGYSLSCGGPIIVPQSENFVITPIAPHNLNVRPIVVSDKGVITLEMESRGPQFRATMDSRTLSMDASVKITLRKASFEIHLLRLNNDNFLNTLRNKLMWGLDKRN